jgi:ornithine carbamoyltransferase
MTDLRGRSFLTLLDYTPEEILYLLDLADKLKADKKQGITHDLLKGKNIVLLFEKTSTRTRCAFEVAGYDEGANVTFLSNSQMGKKESIEDTALVLGRFYDGIEFRGYAQDTVKMLADKSGVPVWNGLTDDYHPTQVLADTMTIREHFGDIKGRKLVFAGDARNNMGNSLMIVSAKLGMHFTAFAPKELWPDEKLVDDMRKLAQETGGSVTLSDDISCVEGADAVYTDIWVSMGEEDQMDERIRLLKPYQVNKELMDRTGNPDAIFLHCLPSFHDANTEISKAVQEKYGFAEMEVTDEVFRSPNSLVFDEAENRLHSIKAVMCATLGNEPNKILA